MGNFFRRGAAEILRTIAQAVDPASEANRTLLYSKNLGVSPGVVPQFYARSTDGARLISGIEKNLWDRPLVAHQYDDEFDSTTLDPAWIQEAGAWSAGGIDPYQAYAAGDTRYELHTDRRPSWMMIQAPANAANQRINKPIAGMPANFFVWFRASFQTRLNTAPTDNDFTLNLILSTSPYDNTNRINVSVNETDNNAIYAEFAKTEGGVFTLGSNTPNLWGAQADLQAIEAVGMQKIGTTYHAWAFGRNGSAIYMNSMTFMPTIGTVAIEVLNSVSGAPGTQVVGVDFVRFKDGALYLP